ncbi:VanZ family protein [Pseudarthrobacter sp. J75]|uniref:VanZ family protein n=1 Tax=unclassified Pseudarthrobacter TaxID=2647000 RepID=UPI002E7FFFA2|nr:MULTISPECIES: VanZ family protein [unclassified Pseudarthrobacter]MEE2524683.1 VanZ family protein [Pseudarthrobacter sp. J47]MEE2528229.1 VanZ family protein [Pseudarthrobacter sp. J75]
MARAWLPAVLLLLAIVALSPEPVDRPVQGGLAAVIAQLQSMGLPTWVDYWFVEAAANILLFVPVGAAASVYFTGLRWWQVGAFGLFISGCIELAQFLFLQNRFATPLDLVTNTGGAFLGTLAVSKCRRMIARLRRRRPSFLAFLQEPDH